MVLLAGLIVGSGLQLWRAKFDNLPDLEQPVIYVVQPYGGMDPAPVQRLFVPLSLAVGFAMIASHVLSSTFVLMRAVTGTALEVRSFMGAIMAVGVAIAGTKRLVFVERIRQEGDAPRAAVLPRQSQLRPILTTCLTLVAFDDPRELGQDSAQAGRIDADDCPERLACLAAPSCRNGNRRPRRLASAGLLLFFIIPLFFSCRKQ